MALKPVHAPGMSDVVLALMDSQSTTMCASIARTHTIVLSQERGRVETILEFQQDSFTAMEVSEICPDQNTVDFPDMTLELTNEAPAIVKIKEKGATTTELRFDAQQFTYK
jgi:hypothetical protein